MAVTLKPLLIIGGVCRLVDPRKKRGTADRHDVGSSFQGKLFSGFINLRPSCEVCGLDYAFIDSGDGPAIFIIMIAGAIVVACALIVEVKYQPPYWVHAVLWLPLILATTLLPLRAMKSLLIALQFHHKAAPGQLIDRDPQ